MLDDSDLLAAEVQTASGFVGCHYWNHVVSLKKWNKNKRSLFILSAGWQTMLLQEHWAPVERMRKNGNSASQRSSPKPYDTCTAVSCLTSFVNSWSKLFSLRLASLIALSICFKSLSLLQTPLLADLASVFTSAWFHWCYGTHLKVCLWLWLWRGLCVHASHCKPQKLQLGLVFAMRCEETWISYVPETGRCTHLCTVRLIRSQEITKQAQGQKKGKNWLDAQQKWHYDSISAATGMKLRGNISYKHSTTQGMSQWLRCFFLI